jgi:uncharacterized membrane protein
MAYLLLISSFMTRTVHALFVDLASVDCAVDRLQQYGFPKNEISITFSDATKNRREDSAQVAKGSAQAALGAAIGGGLGGMLVGFFAMQSCVTAGAFSSAISGMSAGAMGGSLLGILVGSRFGKKKAHSRVKEIQDGGVVLTVQADYEKEQEVRNLLETVGGKFVRATLRAKTDCVDYNQNRFLLYSC